MIKKIVVTSSTLLALLSVSNIVSCARGIGIQNGSNIGNTSKYYKDNFNYQTGPSKSSGLSGSNKKKNIHDFIAPFNFSYVSYVDSNGKPEFFGDKDNILNMPSDDNYTKTVWKNEKVLLQWILIANDDIKQYKNLKLSVDNKYGDDIKIRARFNKFIKTKDKYRASSFDHIMKRAQYMPDAIGTETLEQFKGVKEDSYFDVYPVLIDAFVNSNSKSGIKDFIVNLNYEYNGVEKVLSREFHLDVLNVELNTSDYGLPVEEKFGFSSNQYAHRTMKYLNGVDKLPNNPDGTPNYVDTYDEILSSKNNMDVLAKFREPLTYTNNASWWGDGYHGKKLITYTAKIHTEKVGWTDEDYLNYVTKGIVKNGGTVSIADIFKDKDITFNFNFETLNKYIKFAASNKIEEVTIDPIKVANDFFFYLNTPLNNEETEVKFGGDFKGGGLINNAGKLSSIGKSYVEHIFPKFLDDLIKNLNNIKKDKSYELEGLSKIPRVAILLDEHNEEAIYKIWDVIQEANKRNTGEKINHAIYVGWRANVDWFDESYLKNNVYTKIDRYIYHYRYLTDTQTVKNSDLGKVRDINKTRHKNGLSTYLYATWGDFPGAYLNSDISEMYQIMFFVLNLNFNGFARWAYDWVMNKDLYSTEDLSIEDTIEGSTEESEPGESWLVYGNDPLTHEARPSMRMLAFMDAFEETYKFKNLQDNITSVQKQKELNKILSIIGNTNERTPNNDYKWFLQNKWSLDPKPASNNYMKTVGEQSFEFIYLLDAFAKLNI